MAIDVREWRMEATSAITDAFGNSVDAVGTFVFNYPELVTFEAGCAALAGSLWLLMRYRKNRKTQGEVDEMKRIVQLESTYADKIHDFMLDMLVKGEINRKEYKRDCKRFGIAFRLLDLLRPVKSKIGMKHRVKRNVAANHATLPFIQAGKIPGPKPGEVPALPRKSRKVWIAVGKRRKTA
jgi:hypothetical protein